ncbi:MAG TPA: [protein-PII] uridylyltransferase, partial [Mycobacteriales bacterium]|nr:[protein-PII] uridylyltransferase [Mycobacteriales bacterium]
MSVAQTPSELRAGRAQLLADASLRGAALRAALTELADDFLAGLLGTQTRVALVAVGGYGRREPAAGSDLDLLLLHDGRADIADVADRIWYPIWDTGVGLDHSVRTPAEAWAVAREDLKAALGLLDARHVAGDPALSAALHEQCRSGWRTDARRRLPELVAAVRERAERHGELAFLLEPDLKEARGGLRDVHAIRAVAAAWVADAPGPAVRAAYELLLDVRGELHRGAGRGSNRLVLQEQDRVAAALRRDDADALLTEVYTAGRTIAYALDLVVRRVESGSVAAPRRWSRRSAPSPTARRPLADGVVEQAGEVVLARAAAPARDPQMVLRTAAAAAQAGLPLSPHTLERLRQESAPLPDPWPRPAVDSLVALLGAGHRAVPVWEALDQAGLLTALLPEWEAVRCLPQRNAYHRFTVDRHLTEAAAEAAALTREVHRPDLLLIAALLHDIGKGRPGDHSVAGAAVAGTIGRRLGLDTADVTTLVILVRHHLLLADTATRRDLDDPATVRLVAQTVGSRDTLDLLHALTEADGRATGPAAWSGWKAGLVADLVQRVGRALAGAHPPAPEPLSAAARGLAERGELAVEVIRAGGTGIGITDAHDGGSGSGGSGSGGSSDGVEL